MISTNTLNTAERYGTDAENNSLTGFDISKRLLAIEKRRFELESQIFQCQSALNALDREERELDILQHSITGNVLERNVQNANAFRAAFLKEIIDI